MSRSSRLAALLLVLSALAASLFLPAPTITFAATEPQPHLEHPDQACRTCHQTIYDSYQKTSMARGSGLARDESGVPLLATSGFQHAPSGITYRITQRDGQPTLTYDRPSTSSTPALSGEHPLTYFIGSGKRGRTYLYQQEGFWFEVPINWYGKKKLWDMAPAFENTTSMPDPLPVDANCLHCHTGEVQQATTGARNHFPAQPFRAPGVGCAACHGDPTAHLASSGKLKPGPILNPAHLAPAPRDSICLQCHLEGDATVYLPGKSLATFVPGQPLAESALYFVDRTRAQLGGRASSQYEALLRSACMRAVGDKLTCTTCHDPHSSPAPEQRVAYFRAKCLTCHASPALAATHHPEQQDCALCHMPTRKTLDISHEQLTDHDIEAHPTTSSPLVRRSYLPDLVPVGTPTASPRELGLAYAQLAQRGPGSRPAGERALTLLQEAEKSGSDDPELHTQLGYLLQLSGNLPAAAAEYTAALRQDPQNTTAAANLAVLAARTGNPSEALRLLTQAVAEDPAQTPAALNLAFIQCRLGHKPEALQTLTRALLFNPDNPAARAFLQTGTYVNQSCPLH